MPSDLLVLDHNAIWWCRALDYLDKVTDPTKRNADFVQMIEFGRTPKQLFTRKHPKRRVHYSVNQRRLLDCFRPRMPTLPTKPLIILPRRYCAVCCVLLALDVGLERV